VGEIVKRLDRYPIAAIAVPVGLELMLMLGLNFANQIVVGVLGASAIAAVGFANSLVFILFLTFGGLGTSVSILIARAHGGGRRDDLSQTLTVALIIGGALAVVSAIVPQLMPTAMLHVLGANAGVAAVGSTYFRLVAIAVIPNVLITVLSGSLRSTGYARSPMIATFVTVPLNTLLAWMLVLGVGPFPHLGVAGAGYATLFTTTLRLVVLAWMTFGLHRIAIIEFPGHLEQWKVIVRPLIVLALPLAITEFFWTTGTFLYNVVFQKLGTDELAAAQIANTLEGVFIVGSVGLIAATNALVGKALGAGDTDDAVRQVTRIKKVGVQTSVVFGTFMALTCLVVPSLFPHAGSVVWHAAIIGILINAVSQPLKVRNGILGAGVMPSGNDVKGVILGDVVGAFVVGLPLAIVLGLHTPLAIAGIFLARTIEEAAKLCIFTWRTQRIKWAEIAAHQSELDAQVQA
jgi:putative MATE family efflux protein